MLGDVLLERITPNIAIFPHTRRDTLAAYLDTLRRIEELDPRIALPGHGPPIEHPAARAREIADHHEDRLGQVLDALGDSQLTAYEVSLAVFPSDLPPSLRRMAFGEALAHLEHLVDRGTVVRDDSTPIVYASA